ncbi:MAG: CHAT domain-containing protein [Thiolinea sp.]
MTSYLQIRHIGYQDDKPQFVVTRLSDGLPSAAIFLTPPEQVIVEGRPDSNLLYDLRWYLEKFLELPLGGYLHIADRVQAALQGWGEHCFKALFQEDARDWFQDARRQGLENLTLKIASDDPRVLAWPWEALRDPQGGVLAHHCRIERQLMRGKHSPLPLPDNLPQDRINILLVIARPYGDNDVGFHALSRPLVALAKGGNSPVHIDVLRPPTFEQLRQTLYDRKGFYHIVHFDGHGGYGEAGHPSGSAHIFKGAQGVQGELIFENGQAQEDKISADKLSALLAGYGIPIMVLNACQSAKIDDKADDAFASVAAALLKAGIRSVVAMGYNLYVVGAQQFVPAFYQRLLVSGNVAEATRAGRQAMLLNAQRVTLLGEFPLQDWLVPVLYQQGLPGELVLPRPVAAAQKVFPAATPDSDNPLPEEARELGDYGFIGRERAVQALERACLQQPQAAFLIHGMAGVGKTTLAKGFLHWLRDTNGLGAGAFWFSFEAIRNAEYVINTLVDALFGTNARAAQLEQKLAALVQVLREQPFLLVWDNFESASGIAGTEVSALLSDDDRNLLKKLLKQLRGGKTKVLITSRSPEHWLTPQECYRLPLSGLQGEELWEYCNAVVADLGLKIDRSNQDFIDLIKELDGHPLAIRAILLRLNERKAADLLAELEQQFAGQAGDESTRRIFAALSIFDQGLPEAFAPILQLVGLHQQFVDRDYLESMLQTTEDTAALPQLDACFATLEAVGLLHHLGQNTYRMHPALHHHLSRRHPPSAARQRAFVDFMGSFADKLAPKELHEQRFPFALHGGNFYHALALAQVLGMDVHVAALTQSLAAYAQNTRDYAGASRLFENLANHRQQREDLTGEAGAYHQLGRIAEAQRDYAAAERWYKQSLAISEKHGNEHVAAMTYHQLGIIAEAQRDYAAAERWYKQSLSIKEKHGNEHGAASTYAQLGLLAGQLSHHAEAGQWLLKAVQNFASSGDQHTTVLAMKVFLSNLQAADPATQAILRQRWTEAGLDQTITLDQLEQQLQ